VVCFSQIQLFIHLATGVFNKFCTSVIKSGMGGGECMPLVKCWCMHASHIMQLQANMETLYQLQQ